MSGEYACWLVVRPDEVLGPGARRMLPAKRNTCRRVGDALVLFHVDASPQDDVVAEVAALRPRYVLAHGAWATKQYGDGSAVIPFSHENRVFGGALERYLFKPSAENAAEMMSVLALTADRRILQGYPRPFASHVCWHVLVLSSKSDGPVLNRRAIQEPNWLSVSPVPPAPAPLAAGAADLLACVNGLGLEIAGFQETRAHVLNRSVVTRVETELRGRPFLHALLRRDPLAIRSVGEADVVLIDLELGDTRNSPHELLRHEGIHALRVIREVHPILPVAVRDNRVDRSAKELLASLAAALGCTALFTDHEIPSWYDVLRRAYSWSWLVEQEALASALAGPRSGQDDLEAAVLRLPPDVTFETAVLEREFKSWSGVNGVQRRAWGYLVNRLFPGVPDVRVTRRLGGLSGARNFEVNPNSDATTGATHIVKVGSPFQISTEFANYQEIIAPRLPNFVGRIESAEVCHGIDGPGLGAARVTIAGTPRQRLMTLREFIELGLQESWESGRLSDALDRIGRNLLEPLYGPTKKAAATDYLSAFGCLLPCWVELDFRDPDELGGTPAIVGPLPSECSGLQYYLPRLWDLKNRLEQSADVPVVLDQWPVWETVEGSDAVLQLYERVSKLRIKLRVPPDQQRVLRDPRLHRGRPVRVAAAQSKESPALWVWDCLHDEVSRAASPLWPNERDPLRKIRDAGGCPPDAGCPIEYLRNWINKPTLGQAREGPVHGDLNLDNLLVSVQPGGRGVDVWLVDFMNAAAAGAVASDLVKLDVEIRTQLLADTLYAAAANVDPGEATLLALRAFGVWERGLPAVLEREDVGYDVHVLAPLRSLAAGDDSARTLLRVLEQPRVRSLWGLVEHWRRRVASALVGTEEYVHGTFAYACSCMRFGNLVDPARHPSAPLPRLLAYVMACIAMERILACSPRLPDGPTGVVPCLAAPGAGDAAFRGTVAGVAYRGWELQREGAGAAADERTLIEEWIGALVASELPELAPPIENVFDVGSTGSAGNKAPLIVAAILLAANATCKVVKASSTGSICGTVDMLNLLEVDTLRPPGALRALARDPNGPRMLFASESGLSRIESRLFELRRKHKLMRHRDWVLISILAKRRIAGCGKLLLDVQAGRDFKAPDPFRAVQDPEAIVSAAHSMAGLAQQVRLDGMSVHTVVSGCFGLRGVAMGVWASLVEVVAALKTRQGALWNHCIDVAQSLAAAGNLSADAPTGGSSAYDVFEAAVRAHGGALDGPNLPADPEAWLKQPEVLPTLSRVGLDDVRRVEAQDLWPGWDDGALRVDYVDPCALERAFESVLKALMAEAALADAKPFVFLVVSPSIGLADVSKDTVMLSFSWSTRTPIDQHWARLMVLFGECFVPFNRPGRVAAGFLKSVIRAEDGDP
jgi:hypothetical protein